MRSILTFIATLLFTTSASADWTGLYLQGALGKNWEKYEVSIPILPNNLYNSDFTSKGIAALIGGKADFQINSKIVLGLGGDYIWSNHDVTANIVPGVLSAEVSKDISWNAYATAGYKITDNLLAYGLLGYTRQEFSAATQGAIINWDTDGLLLGGGIEIATSDRIKWNVEFRQSDLNRVDFGTNNFITNDGTHQQIMIGMKFKLW